MPSARLFDLEIAWDKDVYEPYEDSVLLADGVSVSPGQACLDLCTGTGLAALVMARDAGAAVATDVNPHACRIARQNALRNDLWLDVVCMDLASGLDAPFDVITCDPPYLPTGPEDTFPGPIHRAVSGGKDGAVVSRAAIDEIGELLAPEGEAYMVVSSRQPVEELRERATKTGLAWTVDAEQSVGGFEELSRVLLTWMEGHEPPGLPDEPPEERA